MKIGILTFQTDNLNYGAVLQAAALVYVLKKMGYKAESIRFARRLKVRKTLKMHIGIVKRELIKILIPKLYEKKYNSHPKSFSFLDYSDVFDNFCNNWLNETKEKFIYSEDLRKHKFNYDAVIVGSDQVWRWQYMQDTIYSFFLDFVKSPAKKISYAASFGLDYFELKKNDFRTKKIQMLLKQFSAVSVRENSGIKICKEMFDINAVQVLDPTLLAGIEFFNEIITKEDNVSNIEKTADVACCMLDSCNLFEETISILKKQKYSVEDIFPKLEMYKDPNFIPVYSYLKKIKEAKFVITNSFHCVCFSLLFNKNFVCISHQERGLARLKDLLNDVALSGRIVMDNENPSKILELMKENIQYESINKYFSEKRKVSAAFLKESLL